MVEEAGPGTAIAPGTRVAVFNKLFCGACEQCLLGRQNLCTVEPGQLGFNRDGGDAEYVLAPERNLAGAARRGGLRHRRGADLRGHDRGARDPDVRAASPARPPWSTASAASASW